MKRSSVTKNEYVLMVCKTSPCISREFMQLLKYPYHAFLFSAVYPQKTKLVYPGIVK